jgi:serine/threonine-protein kinase
VGSIPYTPLEQYGDIADHTDVRSDLYALGATAYHLLTGEEPSSAQEIFLRPDLLVPPRRLRPDLSPAIEGAILAAMAPHPGSRPPTVDAWLALLRGGLDAESGPLRIQSGQRARPVGPWRALWRENWWLLIAGALLSALVLYLNAR